MTGDKKQVDVCLPSALSSCFSSSAQAIRLRSAMHSRHEVERWYKEVEPIIKTALSRRSTEGIEKPPKFEINGPNDVESIERLRNYYKKRISDQNQFLESINNKESHFTKHLLQHLCITDLNRRKIEELKEELNDITDSNAEIASKNDCYKREINALKIGQVTECKLKNVCSLHNDREARFNQRTEIMLNRQAKKLEKISNIAESTMSSTNVASLRRQFAGEERTRFEVIKPPSYPQISNRRLTSEMNNNDQRIDNRKISSDAEGGGTTTTCSSSGGSTAASSAVMLENFQSRRSKSMNTFAYPFHVNLPKPLIARALAAFNERNAPKTDQH